jgi:iron complex outermembrane recepter protein
MRRHFSWGICLLTGGSLLAPVTVWAQDSQSRASSGLDEIIVTAQKREQSLQDAPISIAVLVNEDLEKRGITTLSDFVSGAVPSLRITPINGRPSTLNITMRGVTPGDATQISRDPTAGVYIDGVYIGRAQGLGAEMFDLERIEVLRGPQGTLFGRNAVSGAISMVSKRPTGKPGLDLTAGVRNFGGRNLKAHVNFPQFAGFSIKLDGVWSERDGWVENSLPGASDWYESERRGARVSVLWEPTGDINVLYSFDKSKDASVTGYGQIGALLPGAPALPPLFSVESKRVREGRVGVPLEPSVGKVMGHGLQASWDVSDNFSLRSISAYRKMSQTQFDNGGGILQPFTPNGSFSRMSYADVHQNQYSQEIQFLGTFSQLEFIIGGFYYRENADEIAYGPFTARFNSDGTNYTLLPFILGPGGLRFPDRASDVHTRSKAIFGQATYTPTILDERLHLTAGLRWTHDHKWGELFQLRGANVSIPFDFESKRLDPSFVLAFDWTDSINTYVKWGRAYRAGGANSRSATYRAFEEEEVSTWEIGAKSELFDRRVRLNVAAFQTRYGNRQVDFPNPANPSNIETLNTDDATTIKGAEFDLTASLAKGLTVSGSYVFMDWKAPVNRNPFTNAIQLGAVTYTPRHAASAAIDHEFEPFDGITLATHLDAVYSSSFYTGGSTSPKTGSYVMINGRVTLSDIELGNDGVKLAVSLWGKNLTNTQWEVFQFNTAGPGLANLTNTYWNEPRTYGIEARVTF